MQKGNIACQGIFTHHLEVSYQEGPCDLALLNREYRVNIQDGIVPAETEHFIPLPSSYGSHFILLYLLKMSAGGKRGVEAHILGLGGIQLAEAHKADTRTKLLAVLVWLSSRTTHASAK